MMKMRVMARRGGRGGRVAVAGVALAAPPKGFERRVEAARAADRRARHGDRHRRERPGDVRQGVRRQATRLAASAVDADTIFPTGSTGKAFTVAALGILVDQGKIGWDDKVIDHLPGFQMYDPWVTREMTIRDLLVHRSGLGLGAGDLLFVPRTNLSRAESVRRLRYIKPATSFRSGFAYDNVLYMVAGQLIEAVTGETWEKFVADHVLEAGRDAALDHRRTTARFASPDRAQPHARMNGGLRGVGDQVDAR